MRILLEKDSTFFILIFFLFQWIDWLMAFGEQTITDAKRLL
jgi:hypothetical protein